MYDQVVSPGLVQVGCVVTAQVPVADSVTVSPPKMQATDQTPFEKSAECSNSAKDQMWLALL